MRPGGGWVCRCVVCSRCGRHTGNSHQGHYWRHCSVTKTLREFHLCCPGDCELEAAQQFVGGPDATESAAVTVLGGMIGHFGVPS